MNAFGIPVTCCFCGGTEGVSALVLTVERGERLTTKLTFHNATEGYATAMTCVRAMTAAGITLEQLQQDRIHKIYDQLAVHLPQLEREWFEDAGGRSDLGLSYITLSALMIAVHAQRAV